MADVDSTKRFLPLIVALGILELAMFGALLLGQIQLQKSMKDLNAKVSSLELASENSGNLETQAQFSMMASRLGALQADLTQIKTKVLQP